MPTFMFSLSYVLSNLPYFTRDSFITSPRLTSAMAMFSKDDFSITDSELDQSLFSGHSSHLGPIAIHNLPASSISIMGSSSPLVKASYDDPPMFTLALCFRGHPDSVKHRR